MITLTEKRLKELENRIPVYEATIADLKKKLDEVNTFPKDIADLKAWMKMNLESMHVLNAKMNDASDVKNQEHAMLLKKTKEHHETLLILMDMYEALRSTVNVNADKIIELQNLHKSLGDKQDAIKKTLTSHNEELVRHNAIQNTIFSRIDAVQNAHGEMQSNQQNMNDAIKESKKDNFLNTVAISAIKSDLDNLPKSLPEKPKSYDAEIAEIRRDIAAILVFVHGQASQPIVIPAGQPLPKYDDKIQSLEQAIAQIYGLLKKYETR